jgi:hypothetical protein
MLDTRTKINEGQKPCKLKFEKLDKEALKIGKDEIISPSYVTMVQAQHGGQEPKIDRKSIRKAVRMLSLVPHSILPKQQLKISEDFKSKQKTINITKEDMIALNQRIKQDVERNDIERLNGLKSDSVQSANKGTNSQEVEQGKQQNLRNSDKYIEELESGKRPNEYGLGDPNSKSFEPDYSGTLEQTEHKHMMEHLDKIPQYIAEIRSKNNQEQENNEEKPNADKYIFGDPNSSTFEVDYSKQYELEDHKYVMDIIKTIGKNKEQENNNNNNNIEQ